MVILVKQKNRKLLSYIVIFNVDFIIDNFLEQFCQFETLVMKFLKKLN